MRFAFEKQATEMLQRLPNNGSTALRVRGLVLTQMGSSDVTMTTIAKRLHMSVATLRRRLDEEGTSHRQLVEEARRRLAVHHLIALEIVANKLGRSFRRALDDLRDSAIVRGD